MTRDGPSTPTSAQVPAAGSGGLHDSTKVRPYILHDPAHVTRARLVHCVRSCAGPQTRELRARVPRGSALFMPGSSAEGIPLAVAIPLPAVRCSSRARAPPSAEARPAAGCRPARRCVLLTVGVGVGRESDLDRYVRRAPALAAPEALPRLLQQRALEVPQSGPNRQAGEIEFVAGEAALAPGARRQRARARRLAPLRARRSAAEQTSRHSAELRSYATARR